MCKIVGREGTASLVVIPALGLEDIARKREGGLEIAPPSGARVNGRNPENTYSAFQVPRGADPSAPRGCAPAPTQN